MSRVLGRRSVGISLKFIIFRPENSPVGKIENRGGRSELGEVEKLGRYGAGPRHFKFFLLQHLDIFLKSFYFKFSPLKKRLSKIPKPPDKYFIYYFQNQSDGSDRCYMPKIPFSIVPQQISEGWS